MSRILLYLLALSALPALLFAATLPVPVPPGPLSEALALVEARRVPEATRVLDSLRPGFDALGPYHYVRARAFSAAGNPGEAAAHYHRASIYATAPALAEISLLREAETEFGEGYFQEAKVACLLFLKKHPDSWLTARARILLGRSLNALGQSREAIRQFEQAGGSAEALYGKANALQRMGSTGEAAQSYAAAVAADARFPLSSDETLLWLGEHSRLSGAPDRAADYLQRVKEPGNRDRAQFGLAEIAAARSRFEEAVKLLDPVTASRDRKLGRTALLRIADIEAAAGKTPEAVKRLEGIVDRFPYTPEYDQALLRLARIQAISGDRLRAVSRFSQLVLRPTSVRRDALDGIEGILLGGREKGAEHLAGLWSAGGRWLLDSSREASLVRLEEDLRGTGKAHLEIVQWLSRYGSAPVRPKYLAAMARHYAESGDAAGLRECLKGLRKMQPGGDDVARAEAYLKYAEKDFRGAAGALLSIGRLREDDLSLLAEVFPQAVDRGKAVAALEEGVARSGGTARVLGRLADALYDADRKADAVRYYRMAAEKDPGHEWSCYRLAVLLGKDGGQPYKDRIRKDAALVRMANAAWKERELDGR